MLLVFSAAPANILIKGRHVSKWIGLGEIAVYNTYMREKIQLLDTPGNFFHTYFTLENLKVF